MALVDMLFEQPIGSC